MWTKRQIVEHAYQEIGLASYSFDISPEEMQAGGRTLDLMMATWNARGLKLGYLLSNDTDLEKDTGLSDMSVEAVVLNLAIRIAPAQGKTVSMDTKANAKAAYDVLISRAAMPAERVLNVAHIPAGGGNYTFYRSSNRLVQEPIEDPIAVGPEGDLDL